jgi:hypothetical protein
VALAVNLVGAHGGRGPDGQTPAATPEGPTNAVAATSTTMVFRKRKRLKGLSRLPLSTASPVVGQLDAKA